MEYWIRTHPEQVPRGAIYDWKNWAAESDPTTIFNRGLFNPNRFMGRANRPAGYYDAQGRGARYDVLAQPQGQAQGNFGGAGGASQGEWAGRVADYNQGPLRGFVRPV